MKKTITWILVADGAVARVFVNEGPGKGVAALPGKEWEADLPHAGRDIASDRPGRSFESADVARHSMEPPTDPRRLEKERFVEHVIDIVAAEAANGAFDRLVVVAEPRTLGAIRSHMPKALASKVHAELPKDLTKQSAEQLAAPLAAVVSL